MPRETLEVRSDKRKPREEREERVILECSRVILECSRVIRVSSKCNPRVIRELFKSDPRVIQE